jgi:hypothetical protein
MGGHGCGGVAGDNGERGEDGVTSNGSNGSTMGKESNEGEPKSRESTDSWEVSIREELMRIIKGNITGNLNTMSNWIPTAISLTLKVINKEGTLN